MDDSSESNSERFDFEEKVISLYNENQKNLLTSKMFDKISRLYREKKFLNVEAYHKEQQVIEASVNIIVDKINEGCPNGIASFITAPGPKHREPYIALLLHCPEEFHNKYSHMLSVDADLQENESYLNNILKKSFEAHENIVVNSQDNLQAKVEKTIKIGHLMKEIFKDEFDKYTKVILDALIDNQAITNSIRMRKEEPENCYFNNYTYEHLRKPYYEFHFEDLILILFKMLRFVSNLQIKLEIDTRNQILVKIWGSEQTFEVLAENEEYSLQLKAYAKQFGLFKEEIVEKKGLLYKEQMVELIDPEHFHNMDYAEMAIEDARNFPPHVPYEMNKNLKFVRYDSRDDFINRYQDPEFKYHTNDEGEVCQDNNTIRCENEGLSIFRNIDKLRLIQKVLSSNVNLEFLSSIKVLEYSIYVRNFKDYKEELTMSNFLLAAFNTTKGEQFTVKTRDYFGEKVGYYFLWLSHIAVWLLFPLLIGTCVFIVSQWKQSIENNTYDILEEKSLTPYTIVEFSFALLLTIWCTLVTSLSFLKSMETERKKIRLPLGNGGIRVE